MIQVTNVTGAVYKPKNSKMSELIDHRKIPEFYENVRAAVGNHDMIPHRYIVSNTFKGDTAELLLYDNETEWRFIIDNFPGQRKFYSTNLPYESWEQFEADLQRIGIHLVAKVPEQRSPTKRWPLLKEGYDILECPQCGKKCFPDAKRADGAIIYNLHRCKVKRFLARPYSFEIDVDGNLVEP